MAGFRFLHAADIHLDSPLRGLRARDEDAARPFADASRKAFANLIDAAIERDVAFVIIAGDLYDGDWRDYATGQFFVRQAARLARANIRLFLIRGNHDAASEISRALPLPDSVHRFSARRVESVEIPELGAVVHGRSFAHRHIAENMAGEFPAARPGWFNIGVLHTSLTGREGHDVYAPCGLDDLLRTGYQYWALGHIHAREVVNSDPPVVFCGNLQGRHARETGPKGATLVSVDNHRVTGLEALALDAARWEALSIDIGGIDEEHAFEEAARTALAQAVDGCDGRPLAVRLHLTGTTALHARLAADRERLGQELQALAATVSDQIFLEKVMFDTAAPGAAGLPRLPIADLEDAFAAALARPELRHDLAAHLGLIRDKAPKDVLALLPDGGDGPDLDSVLAKARDLILSRLAAEPGEGEAS